MRAPWWVRILTRLIRGDDSDVVRGDLAESWEKRRLGGRDAIKAHRRDVMGTVLAWWRPSAVRRRRRLARLEPRMNVRGEEGRMRGWWRDLVFAVRTVRRRPRSAGIVVGILALGIGATTAVYSVVDGVMVRSLPYPDADRLVTVGKEHLLRE